MVNRVNCGAIYACMRAVLMSLLLLIPMSVSAQSLEASVERQTVIDGESVLLYIKGENLTEQPDVSALSKQFDVLDSRRSNSQVIEGGVRKTQFLMRFELLPKNLGQTEIPPFTADGQTTQPIRIDVVERGTPGAVPRDKVFAEVTLDKDSTYVQAQIVMSLHIFDDGSLASVDPPVPVIEDVQVERLPGGDQRIEARDGEEYRVHTWRYALFPQRNGEIEIPRILIPGSVRDADYGGGLILRSMATRRIQIRTAPVSFSAKTKSPDSTGDWWLPVANLNLQHQWSDDIAASQVGEPLTLTLALTTSGSTSNQLPEFSVPDIDGIKIYPDVPELASQPADDGLTSQRREKWSVIPQKSGELTLPEITVKWWDTNADVEREAKIPAQTLMVSGGTAEPQAILDTDNASMQSPPMAEESVDVTADDKSDDIPTLAARSELWKWLALFALLGWLTTALLWAFAGWKRRKALPGTQSQRTEKHALKALRAASETENAATFRAALLSWASVRWPHSPPGDPIEIANRLRSAELATQLQALESSLYSQTASTITLAPVYNTLRGSLSDANQSHEQTDPLPVLN